MKKNATKTGKARIPEVVADEKDFASVLDIITTHRSRALMSVNVESLRSLDIFQLAIGKCFPAQYKRMLIPKEVLQRTFEEYLALPQNIEEGK